MNNDEIFKQILNEIEQLEIYASEQVQLWREAKERPDNSEIQTSVALAKWLSYRDMADRAAYLGMFVEKLIEWGEKN